MGAVPFSASIKIARGAIDLWELLARKRSGVTASTKKIRRLMKLTNVMTAFRKSTKEIGIKRKEAMSQYNKLKKNATKLREHFGKQLIKARAKERKTTVEVQEQQLRHSFGQRALAKRVKRLTGKPRNTMRCVTAPTITVDLPSPDSYYIQSIAPACLL